MKLQWKSVSPEQERRNSLLHGYRSLIGGSRGQGWGGEMGNGRERTGEPLTFPRKGMRLSAVRRWGVGEGSQTPWAQPAVCIPSGLGEWFCLLGPQFPTCGWLSDCWWPGGCSDLAKHEAGRLT